MQPLHIQTPLLKSIPLSKKSNKNIWLKLECCQPSGSFKIRGIGRLCQYWVQNHKQHFVSSSGGNAGLAVAYAGVVLNVTVTVFIPITSKQIYIDALKLLDVTVIISGNSWDEAHQRALAFSKEDDKRAYIHPFDHPIIWDGHSTIIDEVAVGGIKPDAIIASVGGGGLASGILAGMHKNGWGNIPFISVETEGAASFAASIEADYLIELQSIASIATSLGAKKVAENLFNWRLKHKIIPLKVTDKDAILAGKLFLDDHRILVEPASSAALATIYNQRSELSQYGNILVIVCGGSGINLDIMQGYLSSLT